MDPAGADKEFRLRLRRAAEIYAAGAIRLAVAGQREAEQVEAAQEAGSSGEYSDPTIDRHMLVLVYY